MSKAYNCDRCRELFLNKGAAQQYGTDLKGRLIVNTLKKNWYPKRIDLCAKCKAPLVEFLSKWWAEAP